jgi:hypothetical protein
MIGSEDQVEISLPVIVSVYSSQIQNVDLFYRNTGRFLTKMRWEERERERRRKYGNVVKTSTTGGI